MTPPLLGVPLRGAAGLPKPSGKSFHAGKFVAVVYEVTVAGDWLKPRGGGGTVGPGYRAPNDWEGAGTSGGFIGWGWYPAGAYPPVAKDA